MSDYSVTLSTTEPNNYVGLIKLRQGDVASQSIQATITANGQLFNFHHLAVFFNAVLPNGNVVRDKVTKVDYVNSKLNYTVADSFLQEVTQVTAWFSFENDEKIIDSTKNFQYSVIGGWKECIPQGNYIYELSEIQREIEEIIGNKDFTSLLSKISSLEFNLKNRIDDLEAEKAQKDYVDGLIGDIGATGTFKGKDTNANILAKKGMAVGDEWYGTTSLTYLRYNGTSWIDVGTDTKYGDNSVSETMLQNGIVTPKITSFYNRESANVFDITTIKPHYDNGVASIVDGVITTKSLAPNEAFFLNVNSVDNVGKGVQTLPAGTWYLKFKAKGTSGQTGKGSGFFPPRLYGSDGVRLRFVNVSGSNSLEYTDWVWSITVATNVVNYGLLIQNGSSTEVYTIKDFMITDNIDAPFEDYYTYYATDNVRDHRTEVAQAKVDSLSLEVDSITATLKTIESPKVLHCAFIGDSLTEGDYGSVGGTINLQPLNYPYYFKAITGWTGTNFGKSGFTTKNVWDNIVKTMNLSIKYNVVIIMLGTNAGLTDTLDVDCVGDDYTLYAATQTGSYCKIIERIMLNCPTAQIFLCTPPYNDKTGKKEYIVDTGNVVKKIAARYNLQLIDVYAGLGVNKLNKNVFLPIDRLHFGQYGYQKLGIFFASQIKSALSYYEI
ncbi:SGNH/GDSL hydrolase family protein [Lactococcus lactis]|uniref:SGNH/GDSL hydrolase family protein n=1 Tax=Lactococcus lactis TaxID=1358 RepID=UPI00223C0924|nr:SGNH/GDSL hydrolase family protein [Lactococcus lactis]MCT1185770.1 SGNH/GDSL hydrolase family protein [Lactococcus lactis]MCT1190172.1 SGNH/GDSL hydrolase family protein [Lactococcus lactis]